MAVFYDPRYTYFVHYKLLDLSRKVITENNQFVILENQIDLEERIRLIEKKIANEFKGQLVGNLLVHSAVITNFILINQFTQEVERDTNAYVEPVP